MSILQNVLTLIEFSGFYIVPLLCIISLFNLRELREWRGKYCYFILCAVLLGAHIVFGGSPRYLFLGLLPCVLLTGAGALMPLRRLKLKFSPRYFLSGVAILTILVSFYRIADRRYDTEVAETAELFVATETPTIICSVETPQGMVLAGLLRNNRHVKVELFDSWDAAMDFLSRTQYSARDIFFFTRIKRPHTPEEFAGFFRGKYSIYPFDEIACSNGFLLIKFNGKTLDGVISKPRAYALEALPTALFAEKFHLWAKIDLAEYKLTPPGFLVSNSGPATGSSVYLRLDAEGNPPPASRLALYNELCWQEAFKEFAITTQTAMPTATAPQTADLSGQLNDNAPLLLNPSPYFTPHKIDTPNCQNLAVLYRPGSDRFVLSENASANDVRNFTIEDIYLAKSADFALQTHYQTLAPLQTRALKILLLEEQYSKNLNIASTLPPLLTADSTLECAQVPYTLEGALDSLYKLQLPAQQYDIVLVNIFADAFQRPSTVPLQADPAIHRALDDVTSKLQKLYPQSLIVFIMPPPPTAGYSMFPLANSPQISRLAHYHICSAVERWHRQKQPARVELVKLYLTLNPQKDYLRYSQTEEIWMGYSFTDAGKKRIAEDIGAFLAYKIQHKEL